MSMILNEHPHGYTFFELCVVVSMLVVFLLIATPTISSTLERQTVRIFLDQFSTDIYWAESQARSRQILVYIDVYQSWDFYLIRINGKSEKRVQLPKGYRMTSNFPSDRVTFNVDGQIARNGTIYMKNEKGDRFCFVFQMSSGRFYLTKERTS